MGAGAQAQSLRPAVSPGTEPPKVRLFPNPAVSYVQVEWTNEVKPASILVINGITGKQMLATTVSSGPIRINVSDFVPGIYVFRLFSASGAYLGGATFQVSK